MSIYAAVRRTVFPLAAAAALVFGGAGPAKAAVVGAGLVSPSGMLKVCAGDCLLSDGQLVLAAGGNGRLFEPFDVLIGKDGGFSGSFDLGDTTAITFTMEALTVQGNIDPAQLLSVIFVDHGGPTNLAVQLIMPMTGIAGAATVKSTLNGSCTDPTGGSCGSTPIGGSLPPTIGEYLVGAAMPGPPLTSAGIGVGPGSSAPPPPPFGPFMAEAPFDCSTVGGCNVFSTLLSFQGSGGDDVISWASEFQIVAATGGAPIPEPATLGLFAISLIGLGALRRRRRDS